MKFRFWIDDNLLIEYGAAFRLYNDFGRLESRRSDRSLDAARHHELSDAVIGDFHVDERVDVERIEKNVGRLQIEINDAMTVKMLQGVRHLIGDLVRENASENAFARDDGHAARRRKSTKNDAERAERSPFEKKT